MNWLNPNVELKATGWWAILIVAILVLSAISSILDVINLTLRHL